MLAILNQCKCLLLVDQGSAFTCKSLFSTNKEVVYMGGIASIYYYLNFFILKLLMYYYSAIIQYLEYCEHDDKKMSKGS